uniref:Methyl-CpG binding domain protein 1b n=1 Tax=Electrophorus electricus TaxID=8005 RepID=A0AAY5EE92_ELEEL
MEKEEGDVETTPESPSIGEEPVNPEDRTDHSDSTETANTAGDDYGERAFSETGNEPVTRLVEPSVDWLEPLEEDYDEDDDDQSWDLDGSREAELDGLARDSERSHRGRGRGARRRRQFASDEGWEDCPALGEGWKRKVVFRRSGMSVGQSDAYYMSPKGERLRSKIELLRFIRNTVDLTNFDFKLGKFVDGEIPRRGPKVRWLTIGVDSVTEDCGACASCRHSKQNPDSRRPVRCRRRKCLCPSLKVRRENRGDAVVITPSYLWICLSWCLSLELCLVNYLMEPNKSRRSCGRCKGCVSKADCGVCESCVDKPKFGGSNKKRQNCRRRQCKREARVGLLEACHLTNHLPARPRFTYSRKKISRRSRDHWDFEFSDNEAEQERRTKESAVCHVDRGKQGMAFFYSVVMRVRFYSFFYCSSPTCLMKLPRVTDQAAPIQQEFRFKNPHTHTTPQIQTHTTITQIFSLGGRSGGVDLEPGLLQLLSALRGAVLPVLWCAVLAEGPRLQLLQCSKLSSMADTAVQIEPGFCYHVTVQGQPLLPTHRIYYAHPTRLTSPAQVAALLEDLERYAVCRGLERELPAGPGPVILERAATCDFLVPPEVKCCTMCKKAQQKQ